jgi:hypothetical protein
VGFSFFHWLLVGLILIGVPAAAILLTRGKK